ncbi:Lrp/AsnC family transcriptional regulator [Candidatus Woesearchaeota archaeon]|nr:Lrp/AsnC family transcriptional regulator [Candidatus Woesearchaeota archaeon]
MDEIDVKILEELQQDADRKIYQIEKKTKIPRSTIHNRIKKLKSDKVISKIKAVVDPLKLNLNVTALVHIVVSFKKGVHAIADEISKLQNVEEVYITSGVFDIIAKVRFKNNEELSRFIFDDKTGLKVREGIERTETMICLERHKENGVLIPPK